MKIYDTTFDLLQRAMDVRMKRHAVLSSNIANSETPNYKARELDFAGELNKVLTQNTQSVEKTNPLHMDLDDSSTAHIVFDNSAAVGADGNNVDLDISMGKLAENVRGYSNASTWLGVQLRLLKNVARGRLG